MFNQEKITHSLLLYITNTRFLLVCKGLGWSLTHKQPTVSTHPLDWKAFQPHQTPPIFHSSRVNMVCGVYPRFFHPDPQMKELILRFLTLSLSVTSAFQPALWLTLGQIHVTLSIFYLFSEVEEQAAAAQVKLAQTSCNHSMREGRVTRTQSGCIHSELWRGHSVVGGVTLLYIHDSDISLSHTHAQFDNTYCAGGVLSSSTAEFEAALNDSGERWHVRLAGEHTELLVWATLNVIVLWKLITC